MGFLAQVDVLEKAIKKEEYEKQKRIKVKRSRRKQWGSVELMGGTGLRILRIRNGTKGEADFVPLRLWVGQRTYSSAWSGSGPLG